MKPIIVSTRLPNTFETRRRISGQVLRTLIDERLKMQEAKRRNILLVIVKSHAKANIEKAKSTAKKQSKPDVTAEPCTFRGDGGAVARGYRLVEALKQSVAAEDCHRRGRN